jgi:hypothetical protein
MQRAARKDNLLINPGSRVERHLDFFAWRPGVLILGGKND